MSISLIDNLFMNSRLINVLNFMFFVLPLSKNVVLGTKRVVKEAGLIDG